MLPLSSLKKGILQGLSRLPGYGRVRYASLLAAAILLVLPEAYASKPADLRSPWDAQIVALTDAPYTCPVPPPFSKSLDVEGYYSDANHSVVDPKKFAEHQKATEPLTNLAEWTTQAADAYRARGSRAASGCVYALLDAAARAHAWSDEMPNPQDPMSRNGCSRPSRSRISKFVRVESAHPIKRRRFTNGSVRSLIAPSTTLNEK